MKQQKQQKPKQTQVAEIASPTGNSVKVGSHIYYEMRRREEHPERYNYVSIFGSEMKKRVKGRSKRGWTAATK